MTDSRSAATQVAHRWVGPAVAFGAALTITLAAVRGSPPVDQDVVVTVDDGTDRVAEGRPTTYRITIGNRTDRPFSQLEVTLRTPSSLLLGRSSGGWPQLPTETRWLVDVAADGTTDVELSGVVEELPPDEAELMVIACASGADVPLTCGTDVNIDSPAVEARSDVAHWLMVLMTFWQFLLTAPLMLLVVVATWRRLRRRHRSRDQRLPS